MAFFPMLWQETGQKGRKRELNPVCGKYEGNSSRVKNSGSVGTFWAGSTPRCKQTAIHVRCPTAMWRNPLSSPGRGPGAKSRRAGLAAGPAPAPARSPWPGKGGREEQEGERRQAANEGGGRAVRGLLGARRPVARLPRRHRERHGGPRGGSRLALGSPHSVTRGASPAGRGGGVGWGGEGALPLRGGRGEPRPRQQRPPPPRKKRGGACAGKPPAAGRSCRWRGSPRRPIVAPRPHPASGDVQR